MKKFQFRLEQVLQQRVAKEEQTLLEQVKAQQECLNCRQSLEETHYKLEEAVRFSEKVAQPDEQLHSLLYREHLQLTLDRQSKMLDRAQEILELRREATVKARQERMVLEKLKEKQWNQYKEQEAYLVSKEIDELATLGYARAHH